MGGLVESKLNTPAKKKAFGEDAQKRGPLRALFLPRTIVSSGSSAGGSPVKKVPKTQTLGGGSEGGRKLLRN